MLLLIDTDRHFVGLVKQDIRRHQHRVVKQADIDVVSVLGGFVLELGHAAHLAEHGVAVEYPRKLCMGGYMALNKEDRFLRVDTAGDILREQLKRLSAQPGRVLADGDSVHVNNTVDAVVFILEGGEMLNRAQVISQRQMAGGLHARENRLFMGISHL